MEGTIVNFRKGRHTQYTNQMVVKVDSIESLEKAKPLVGKTAVWTSPANREIKGNIQSTHGNKGVIRVLFEKGMPGQAVGTKVKIQ